MNNVEYEYKKMITSDDYYILKNRLDNIYTSESFLQINYYYDDHNFSLFCKGETLRVRQKRNKLTLEYKYNKHYSSNGERICDESSRTIEFLPDRIMMDHNIYFHLGELVTIRRKYVLNEIIIYLDINYFLGKIDYELEVETMKSMLIPKFISKLIDMGNPQEGKYTRFVNALKKRNKYAEI